MASNAPAPVSPNLTLRTTTTASPELPQFTLFPKLPAELQLKIWRATIQAHVINFKPRGGKAPEAMNVCKASHEQIRKRYGLCIMMGSQTVKYFGKEWGFFVNYDIDILLLTPIARLQPQFRADITRRTTKRRLEIEMSEGLSISKMYASGSFAIVNQFGSCLSLFQRALVDCPDSLDSVFDRLDDRHGLDPQPPYSRSDIEVFNRFIRFWTLVLLKSKQSFPGLMEIFIKSDNQADMDHHRARWPAAKNSLGAARQKLLKTCRDGRGYIYDTVVENLDRAFLNWPTVGTAEYGKIGNQDILHMSLAGTVSAGEFKFTAIMFRRWD